MKNTPKTTTKDTKKTKDTKRSNPAATMTVDRRVKDFLTDAEIKEFLNAAKKGTHGKRDYCMALLGYRHGLRVSELIDIRVEELDMKTGRIWVRRLKGSLSTEHRLQGDELRAVRAWLAVRKDSDFAHLNYLFFGERGPFRRQAINYLFEQIGRRAGLSFKVRPHMLRHSCGYYLANEGYDTRLIQDYLGHQNIHHTVRYTRTNAKRFDGLKWK